MKDNDKSLRIYWKINNLYGLVMSETLLEGGFKSVENISQFSREFIENCNEDNDEEYFLEVNIQYPKILHDLLNHLTFLPKRTETKKVEKTCSQLA